MALINIRIRSKIMVLCTNVTVIMPERREYRKPLKVLWLLHGFSDDDSAWTRNTSIERYVEDKNLCVIMPAVDHSFYSDMIYGNKYFTYVTDELPKFLSSMLNISTKKEDNFIAGLSMGGYGAFKVALNQPERFTAAASFSGVLDLLDFYKNKKQYDDLFLQHAKMIFGGEDDFEKSKSDLMHMAEVNKDSKDIPRLYMCCGKNDFLFHMNVKYHEHLNKLDIPVTYEEDEGFEHTWDYWDMKIQKVIEWMGL